MRQLQMNCMCSRRILAPSVWRWTKRARTFWRWTSAWAKGKNGKLPEPKNNTHTHARLRKKTKTHLKYAHCTSKPIIHSQCTCPLMFAILCPSKHVTRYKFRSGMLVVPSYAQTQFVSMHSHWRRRICSNFVQLCIENYHCGPFGWHEVYAMSLHSGFEDKSKVVSLSVLGQ